MSFMTTLKEKLGMSKDKAGDLARQHGDKIDQGLDKAGDTMDKKTGGKYGEKIDSGVEKAKGAVDDHGKKSDGSS